MERRKMRVLIVHYTNLKGGGAELVVKKLEDYLIDMRCEVKVVQEGNLAKLWWEAQKWLSWCDVISAHNFPAALACLPAPISTKPIVWMCNEPPELFTNWKRKPIEALNRWWVKASHMKVVVADEMQAVRFTGIYGVVPEVIHYGVDYAFWSQ